MESFKAEKELNLYRLQNWRKNVRPRVTFFELVPKLAHLSTDILPNFFVLLRIRVPNCRGIVPTCHLFCVYSFRYNRFTKVTFGNSFFYVWVLFWKVLVLWKAIFYILLFLPKFVRYLQKKTKLTKFFDRNFSFMLFNLFFLK